MSAPLHAPRSLVVDRLVAAVRKDVDAREAQVSFRDIKARSRAMDTPRDAKAAFLAPGCSIITELKRAVPYRGDYWVDLTSPSGPTVSQGARP